MFNIALQPTTDNALSMTLRDHLYLIDEKNGKCIIQTNI